MQKLSRLWRRTISILLAAMMLLSGIQVSAASTASVTDSGMRLVKVTALDGEYNVPFTVLKNGSEEVSVMQMYAELNSGKLIVKDGQMEFVSTWNDYDWFKFLGSLEPGKSRSLPEQYAPKEEYDKDSFIPRDYIPASVIKTESTVSQRGNPPADTVIPNGRVTISFPVTDLRERLELLTHIKITDLWIGGSPLNYNWWYNIQIKLDTSQVPVIPVFENEPSVVELPEVVTLGSLNTLIGEVQKLHDDAKEGTGDGFYLPGAKLSLNNVLSFAKATASLAKPTQTQLTEAYALLAEAVRNFNALLISVDKSELLRKIEEARSLQEEVRNNLIGTKTKNIATIGEYANYNSVFMLRITSAETIYNDPQSIQEIVDAHTLSLSDAIHTAHKGRVVSDEVTNLIVLDNLQNGGTASSAEKTAFFGSQAEVLRLNNILYANVTVNKNTELDEDSIYSYFPEATGKPEFTTTKQTIYEVNSGDDSAVKQLMINRRDTHTASGIAVVYYNRNSASVTDSTYASVTEAVYLSFNANQLAALDLSIKAAQQLHDQAVEGTETGQYAAGSKAALQAAIDAAKITAGQLAASRPQISQSSADLEAAVETFGSSVVSPEQPGEPEQPGSLADGQYTIGYRVFKDGTNDESVMEQYVVKPALLTVNGDRKEITLTLRNSSWIKVLKTDRDAAGSDVSKYVDVEVVSEDASSDNRVVRFTVNNLSEKLNAFTHIIVTGIPGFEYDHQYIVQFQFDAGSLNTVPNPNQPDPELDKSGLQAVIAEAQAVYFSAVEGRYKGQYPTGKKSELYAAIEAAKAVLNQSQLTQQQLDEAVITLNAALETFQQSVNVSNALPDQPNQIADGTYYIPFKALHASRDALSSMSRYFIQPASLKVEQGKKKVSFTVTDSSVITEFKVNLNGELVDTTVVSTDAASNTRVVQFEVTDLTAILPAQVKIETMMGNGQPYVSTHSIRLAFEAGGIVPQLAAGKDYNVNFVLTSGDESGASFNEYMESAGKLKAQDGKQLVTFTLKPGVTVAKVEKVLGDGTLEQIYPQLTAKAAGWVQALSTQTTAQFEIDDLLSNYVVSLQTGTNEIKSFKLAFSNITAVSSGGSGGTGGTGGGVTSPVTKSHNGFTDGVYSINFEILKYNTTQASVMMDYVKTPATLRVSNGEQYISITLKQSKEVTGFRVERNGSMTTPETTSVNDKENTRVVEFQVPDLTQKMKGWVKVDWDIPETGFNYHHEYDIHLSFNVATAKAVSTGTGTAGGQTELTPAEQLDTGSFELPFALYEFGSNEPSELNEYLQGPALLKVQNNGNYVELLITKHREAASFRTDYGGQGVLKDANVIAVDEAANTRVVQFEIYDLTRRVNVRLKLADGREISGQIEFDEAGKKPSGSAIQEEEAAAEEGDHFAKGRLLDMDTHWAKAAIERARSLDIVNGYEDGTFRPDAAVTRAEFAAMLSRALKLPVKEGELSFKDAANIPDWVKPNLAAIVSTGIIGGYEDGTFRADRLIQRSEATVMIVRALQVPLNNQAVLPFSDAEQIPDWAQTYVAAAYEQNIVKGKDGNLFAPNDSTTRAEAVTLIITMLDQLEN